jgi:hypothetical protein
MLGRLRTASAARFPTTVLPIIVFVEVILPVAPRNALELAKVALVQADEFFFKIHFLKQ